MCNPYNARPLQEGRIHYTSALDLHQNPFVRVKKTVEKLGRKLILNHHREKAVGLFVFVGKDIVGLLPQLWFQHD
jgi:hypothetical protein